MSFEHIHQLIHDKNWQAIAKEIQLTISKNHSCDERHLLELFEEIDEDFRKKNCFELYHQLWSVALRAGKIKLARAYAHNVIEELLKYKRVPALKNFLTEIKSAGLLREESTAEIMIAIITGKLGMAKVDVNEYWELMQLHPEHWKASRNFLKNYLIQEDEWDEEKWKLAYEFILNFHFDADVLKLLAEKASELGKSKHRANFERYFRDRKMPLPMGAQPMIKKKRAEKNESFRVDYDQLALEVLSGEITPSIQEQRKVIVGLKNLSEEELKSKGRDMVVAFGLLGMELVVRDLCDRIIPLMSNVHERASLWYSCAQSFFDCEQYYKTIDIVDDVLEQEPLLLEEQLAFEYLKAEALFKLKKTELARKLFCKVRNINPHFRLVGQRLKELEASQ